MAVTTHSKTYYRVRTAVRATLMLTLLIGAFLYAGWYDTDRHEHVLPACLSEDAPNAPCAWRADVEGNGIGCDFYALTPNIIHYTGYCTTKP